MHLGATDAKKLVFHQPQRRGEARGGPQAFEGAQGCRTPGGWVRKEKRGSERIMCAHPRAAVRVLLHSLTSDRSGRDAIILPHTQAAADGIPRAEARGLRTSSEIQG